MANPEHLAILKQGVKVWNEWREENKESRPDLSEIDLQNIDLRQVNFVATNLRRANLKGVYLFRADLSEAILQESDLRNANLNEADLFGANLTRANLDDAEVQATLVTANLRRAKLRKTALETAYFLETNLRESDLSGAIIGATTFADIDLSKSKGLENVLHDGPSTIGIDTIYKSGGNIPESFLRGCGVPETFITYARSLVGKPIDFHSCFISHSSKDKRFCERLYADLQAKGVRVWYFPEDAKWGEPVWGEIDRSIKVYDKLIVVCSKNALASVPVQREIERALNREDKEHKNILFPITIDDYVFDNWDHPRKADALAKVVGDFRDWNRNTDKYDKAFKKLLKALKAE